MKKMVQAIGAMIALSGLAATPQTTTLNQSPTEKTQRHNEAIDKQIAPKPFEDLRELHSSGTFIDNSGLSPKEYGQMLQSKGLQKWNKKGKR